MCVFLFICYWIPGTLLLNLHTGSIIWFFFYSILKRVTSDAKWEKVMDWGIIDNMAYNWVTWKSWSPQSQLLIVWNQGLMRWWQPVFKLKSLNAEEISILKLLNDILIIFNPISLCMIPVSAQFMFCCVLCRIRKMDHL